MPEWIYVPEFNFVRACVCVHMQILIVLPSYYTGKYIFEMKIR